MRPYLAHEHPLRLAHRGSTILWPENTLTAFQGAVDLGLRYIETDVHRTRDGTIVLFHDHRLERLTNGTGRISDWYWEDLRLLDAGYRFRPDEDYPRRGTGERIPGLEEALLIYPDRLFNLDVKQPGIEGDLAELVRRLGAEDRVLVGSFHDRRIQRFRKASAGRVATSAGPAEASAAWAASRVGRAAPGPADALQIPARLRGLGTIDERFVAAAHAGGKHVHVWTVNEMAEMHRLLDVGVDGIVTDRPDLLIGVLNARRLRQ